MTVDVKSSIAARAAQELRLGEIVNLGIGMPKFPRDHQDEIAGVLAEMTLPEVEEVHVVDRRLAALTSSRIPVSPIGR